MITGLSLALGFSHILMIRTLWLNQVGPGWEVPVRVMGRLSALGLGVFACLAGVMAMIWHLRGQMKKWCRSTQLLLGLQGALSLFGVLFLLAVEGFEGQYWEPERYPFGLILCLYAAAVLLGFLSFKSAAKEKKEDESPSP